MKKSIIIITLAIPLFAGLLSSCISQGFISNTTKADIRQMSRFEMLANVGLIEKSNKVVYNDSLTEIAKTIFTKELNSDKTLPVTQTVAIEDSVVNNKVQYEIYLLMQLIENNARIKDIQIPPTIDSILCSRNERFGLLVYNYGFVRSNSNYAGQVAKGIAIGILTLGTAYTVPYKDMTRSGIIIVDSKNHNLAYVASSNMESSPLNPETYKKQMKVLLKKYKN